MPYYGTELYSQCQQYNTVNSAAWGNDYFSPNTIGTQTVPMEEIQKIRNEYLKTDKAKALLIKAIPSFEK